MDLQVSVGGRLRVVHTTCLPSTSTGITRAFDFTLHPLDPSRVLIAGDQGKLVNGTRLGGTRLGTLPRWYQANPYPVDAVAVATHPSSSLGLLLVGCADGVVTLHQVERSTPICEWDVKSRCTVCNRAVNYY